MEIRTTQSFLKIASIKAIFLPSGVEVNSFRKKKKERETFGDGPYHKQSGSLKITSTIPLSMHICKYMNINVHD